MLWAAANNIDLEMEAARQAILSARSDQESLDAMERYAHLSKERAVRRREERKQGLISRRAERMNERLERRRTMIRDRTRFRTLVVCAWLALALVGVPIAVIVISIAWRAAAWAVAS